MRVRATQDFRTYVDGLALKVTAGRIFSGTLASALVRSRCPVEPIDPHRPGPDGLHPEGSPTAADLAHATPSEPDAEPEPGQKPDPRQPGPGPDREPEPEQQPDPRQPGPGPDREPEPEQGPEPEPSGLDLVAGSIGEVLDRVAGDPATAVAAAAAERARDKPRVALLRRLDKIAG